MDPARKWKPFTKVFAKVPGFPYWPGAIIPQERYPISIGTGSEKQVGVLFYGSLDYSLVRHDLLKDFDNTVEEFSKTRRKDLQRAILHAQQVNTHELINLISPELYATPIPDPSISIDIDSPRKSGAIRKSRRRKPSEHKDIEKIVKIKRYLAHRIYGEHALKVNVDKIDKMICWLSSITDINFKAVEESRIGHVLAYIAAKPPKSELGDSLIVSDIPNKCKLLIERWKTIIKAS